MIRELFRRKTDPTALDEQITKVLHEMNTVSTFSDEYKEMIKRLEQLHKLKAKESPTPVSRDTIWIVVGNVVGIVIIVAYEHKHVIGGRAFDRVSRPIKGA